MLENVLSVIGLLMIGLIVMLIDHDATILVLVLVFLLAAFITRNDDEYEDY